MAKRVAVIDIGSNSIRMVIYEKTSRFAFHLLYEAKSKVRISQDAYKNGGELQEIPMQRTADALSEFLSISKSFHVKKILCVATSALRDAPNKASFLSRIKSSLKLNIKIINGEREAYFGAIACANLLPMQKNGLSIDIGGGSTEFALIDEKDVSHTLSLELGTVRLKELFFDNDNIDGAIVYIDAQIKLLEGLNPQILIGIGGTFRAIAIAIMNSHGYPFNKIHAYEPSYNDFIEFIDLILKSDDETLIKVGIKQNRLDIIKPGTLILQRVLQKLSINKIITSGVGVREGVYLSDLLRHSNDKLPHNFNTSVRYIIDSHIDNKNHSNNLNKLSKTLFDLTHKHLQIDKKYRHELAVAAKLYPSGGNIHFYSKNRHTYYLIKSALEYGFTHAEIILIATLTRYAKNKLPSKKHIEKYLHLLPNTKTLNALSYLLSLATILLSHRPRNIDFDLKFKDGILKVESKNKLYLSKDLMEKIEGIEELKISF